MALLFASGNDFSAAGQKRPSHLGRPHHVSSQASFFHADDLSFQSATHCITLKFDKRSDWLIKSDIRI